MSGKSTKSERWMDTAEAASLVPRRQAGAHKWSVGGLVIVGGAPGYIGAPALCARAALRAGVGIVSVAVSRSSVGPIAGIVPEATFLPLPDGDPAHAARKAVVAIGERAAKSAAFVVGPGLSDDDHAQALLAELFGMTEHRSGGALGFGSTSAVNQQENTESLVGGSLPAVVDADALNWLSVQPEWWIHPRPQSLLLTPHGGEMARLTGTTAAAVAEDPVSAAVQAARAWNQCVLLKGSTAVLTDGSRTVSVEGIPASLASAGTGDVLAGTVGAFLAQGLSLFDSARLAIFVGTQAARDVESRYGTLGLMAGDLPDAIGRSIAELERVRHS